MAAPLLMGVVNITPNSFSDGALYLDPAAAVAHGRQLIADGANLLDLGAEASSFFRPGVEPVPPEEQLRRLLPVIAGLRDPARAAGVRLSIDTRSAAVARACIAAGADVVNDISAGRHDLAMFATVAALGVPLVLMSIGPTFPDNPPADDPDILRTVRTELAERCAAARAAGVRELWVDPGIGFGRTPADNWRLCLRAAELADLGPVVLGASRKRFLQSADQPPQRDRLAPLLARLAPLADTARHERDLLTAAVTVQGAAAGVAIHRVHNVALCAAALAIIPPTVAAP